MLLPRSRAALGQARQQLVPRDSARATCVIGVTVTSA